MNDHTKGYLEGLQAAALICQENAGERNSHLSDKIMAVHSRKMLEGERKANYFEQAKPYKYAFERLTER